MTRPSAAPRRGAGVSGLGGAKGRRGRPVTGRWSGDVPLAVLGSVAGRGGADLPSPFVIELRGSAAGRDGPSVAGVFRPGAPAPPGAFAGRGGTPPAPSAFLLGACESPAGRCGKPVCPARPAVAPDSVA
ncbi:hypothetical protein [Streptomyces phaeochromogenes]